MMQQILKITKTSIARLLLAILPFIAPGLATACEELFSWKKFLDPGPQDYQVGEKIDLQKGLMVVGIKFGELKGDFAKKHLFMLYEGKCPLAAVSLGSYAATAILSDGTDYHLDLYEVDTHSTLGFYNEPLSYEATRAIALKHFKEYSKP